MSHRHDVTGDSGNLSSAVEVRATGPLTLIEDLGREGFGAYGVGTSGAADRGALRLANRLVGNAEDAAAFEVTMGGLVLRAHRRLTIAVTGAPAPVDVDGRIEAHNSVIRVSAGQIVSLGPPPHGLRSYLAVRGGLDVRPVLGSRSMDVMSGIGPPQLTEGMVLDVGPPPEAFPVTDLAPVEPVPSRDVVLRTLPGPRDDWFTVAAVDALWSEPFVVSSDSNRVGIRLLGPALERRTQGELASEGAVVGSLQVPTSGRLTLFLADHPVTGGYPVIAVVISADIERAAQVRPGQRLWFRRV